MLVVAFADEADDDDDADDRQAAETLVLGAHCLW
jgi:hypothetical protein